MFTIRNFESRTISWWYDQKENIDFNPSYQRKGRLWSLKDKSYLIDSILNGFDMPKIYIADFTFFSSELNEDKKPYAVIDGKQRFEAIFDFYNGDLILDKDFVLFEDSTISIGGLSLKDLKAQFPKIASKFENFNLSVISVITNSEAMINEMFIRLNKSKPLTGAELRNAMKGDVPKFTRQIIEHPFFRTKIRFNTNRGQDSNVATKLMLIEFRGKFVDTKKRHLDKLVEETAIAAETTNLNNSFIIIKKVLDYMDASFINQDPILSSSGLIPVYYWFFRKYGNRFKTIIRNYLAQFELKRKESRINPDADTEYFLYDRLSKSSNDQASLQGCYNILEKKWLIWLKENKLN